ncbi:MAG: flagellar protein export ATPase FliI [Candidatus Sericytochromatia bacterium]
MTESDIPSPSLNAYFHLLEQMDPLLHRGQVKRMVGHVIEAEGPAVQLGELCELHCDDRICRAEVVGFQEHTVLLMPLDEMHGIRAGTPVVATGRPQLIPVGEELLGRILDPYGEPIDEGPPLVTAHRSPLDRDPPSPLKRKRIQEILPLGVRVVDTLLTCGKGQRMGIFSGSGVGKSTLLGMMARHAQADVNVIGLIGERGREVREFIEKDLGPEGLKRSVVVAVTSDQPALLRIKGAYTATAIAEYFRDQGLDVLLMLDSVTRFAMARREIGLAIGEPPATRGYPPSMFALLPRLLERSGTAERGSITALYTVLVEGDDTNEPVADTVRGILDGHIVLTRALASRNHYPAVDVQQSISRLAQDLASPEQRQAAAWMREMLAVYGEAEDLIQIGAYTRGSSREVDEAIDAQPGIRDFLRQNLTENAEFEDSLQQLFQLASRARRPGR